MVKGWVRSHELKAATSFKSIQKVEDLPWDFNAARYQWHIFYIYVKIEMLLYKYVKTNKIKTKFHSILVVHKTVSYTMYP